MPNLNSLSNIGTAEATTLTAQLNAFIRKALQEQGKDQVSELVLQKIESLLEATQPLHHLTSASTNERRAADNASDAITAGIRNILGGIAQTYASQRYPLSNEQQQRNQDAQVLLEQLFPDGTRFLNSSYTNQFGSTRLLLNKAKQPDLQKAIKRLSLQHEFSLLATAHEEYGRVMGFTTADEKPDPLEAWAEALESYLAAVVTIHPRGTDLRVMLLAPYEAFLAQQRERRARERQKPRNNPTETPQPSPTETPQPSPTEELNP